MKIKSFLFVAAMLICGAMMAQEYEPRYQWNPYAFESNMTFRAKVCIDGVEQQSTNVIEIGAFNGDVVTSSAFVKPFGSAQRYRVNMTISGGSASYNITFKLYNHETGEELLDYTITDPEGNLCQTITYASDGNLGSYADPYVLNFVTTRTFTKDIAAYTENGGYYLIATPIGEVSPANVTNMLANNYDLYYFNQSQDLEWVNYKEGEGSSDPGFNLIPGMGYLYANSENVTLTFTGVPYESNGEVTLYKDDNADFPGWNLVGNPFAQTAYINNRQFYIMNPDGTEIIVATRNYINAMEGIFVIAEENEESMTFSTEPIQAKGQIVLNVSGNDRGNAIDRAIVRFTGDMLPKFMLNENNTKMYIPESGDDFAVMRSNKKSGKLPINFEPAENGDYEISVNVENLNMRYLHLIDNLTGTDIDLLRNPNYRFNARTTDYADRFVLEFKVVTNPFHQLFFKENTNVFGFFSNGEWIINNEGDAILQVVDINGQILSNEEINGSVSKHIDAAPGVYMLRLIKGKDIKVQKIVIK